MVTMSERMMKIETEVGIIKDSLKDHTDNQREDFDKLFKKIDNLDGKYSAKWVEKGIIALTLTTVGSIIVALISLL